MVPSAAQCVLPTVCPVNVRMGLVSPSWHTWMVLSEEDEANSELSLQATSSTGPLWNSNCCFT